MLKMIELNNYIINLSLNFDDISSTFDMKDLVIHKTQQLIPGDLFETPTSLSLSLAKKKKFQCYFECTGCFYWG